jgi:hypothetical protein
MTYIINDANRPLWYNRGHRYTSFEPSLWYGLYDFLVTSFGSGFSGRNDRG